MAHAANTPRNSASAAIMETRSRDAKSSSSRRCLQAHQPDRHTRASTSTAMVAPVLGRTRAWLSAQDRYATRTMPRGLLRL